MASVAVGVVGVHRRAVGDSRERLAARDDPESRQRDVRWVQHF